MIYKQLDSSSPLRHLHSFDCSFLNLLVTEFSVKGVMVITVSGFNSDVGELLLSDHVRRARFGLNNRRVIK